jgi:hypothetical protein
VDIFGVSNWLRTLQSIPKWWEAQRAALYKEIGDPRRTKFLRETRRSSTPTRSASRSSSCRRQRSPRHQAGVRRHRGVGQEERRAVRVRRLPDEGHGFSKKKNQIEGWRAILAFLDKYLKSSPAGAAKAAAGN